MFLKSATKETFRQSIKKRASKKIIGRNRKWDMESETVTPDGFPVDLYKKLRTT